MAKLVSVYFNTKENSDVGFDNISVRVKRTEAENPSDFETLGGVEVKGKEKHYDFVSQTKKGIYGFPEDMDDRLSELHESLNKRGISLEAIACAAPR